LVIKALCTSLALIKEQSCSERTGFTQHHEHPSRTPNLQRPSRTPNLPAKLAPEEEPKPKPAPRPSSSPSLRALSLSHKSQISELVADTPTGLQRLQMAHYLVNRRLPRQQQQQQQQPHREETLLAQLEVEEEDEDEDEDPMEEEEEEDEDEDPMEPKWSLK
jgi:hypothetical protein